MRKLKMGFITISIATVITGCTDNMEESNLQTASSGVSQNTSTQTSDDTIEFKEYTNARYGFSIDFPAEWTAGEESDNGDGKILYVGNPDVDIRVYASNYLESISDPYYRENENIQLQKIKLEKRGGSSSSSR